MPERYDITILPRAAADLDEVFSYISQHSPQNAIGVTRVIVSAIDSLELLPHRYKILTPRKDPSRNVHSMPVPPFLIYYRIDDRKRRVRVLTIRHGARRQPRRFE